VLAGMQGAGYVGRRTVLASPELQAQARDCYFSDGGCAARPFAAEESRMLTSWRCFFGMLFPARGDEQYGENLRRGGSLTGCPLWSWCRIGLILGPTGRVRELVDGLP
jgi:hypothetical protein